MTANLIYVLGLAAAGITVASTGAVLLVIRLVLSPSLAREIDSDLRREI